MAEIKPPTVEQIRKVVDAAERAIDYKALRETGRKLIDDVEKDEDEYLGKREAKEFFEAEKDFEPERNKLVKTSDVIIALNLIAAHFIVRTWPKYLRTKIEEWVISKIAGAAGTLAGYAMAVRAPKAMLQKSIGAVVGAFAVKATQEAEMRALEKAIRSESTKVRRELNDNALSQAKKPVRMGPVSTRNG